MAALQDIQAAMATKAYPDHLHYKLSLRFSFQCPWKCYEGESGKGFAWKSKEGLQRQERGWQKQRSYSVSSPLLLIVIFDIFILDLRYTWNKQMVNVNLKMVTINSKNC